MSVLMKKDRLAVHKGVIEIKSKKKTPGFVPAKSKAAWQRQQAAIRKYYAKKKLKNDENKFVSVTLKRHRDKNDGHRHVILENIEDKHVSVGLTTKVKKGKNSTNYNCKSDVLGNGENSYMRRQGTVDLQSNYFSPTIGLMTEEAYEQAKIYGERAKQRYLDKKEKVMTVPNTSEKH